MECMLHLNSCLYVDLPLWLVLGVTEYLHPVLMYLVVSCVVLYQLLWFFSFRVTLLMYIPFRYCFLLTVVILERCCIFVHPVFVSFWSSVIDTRFGPVFCKIFIKMFCTVCHFLCVQFHIIVCFYTEQLAFPWLSRFSKLLQTVHVCKNDISKHFALTFSNHLAFAFYMEFFIWNSWLFHNFSASASSFKQCMFVRMISQNVLQRHSVITWLLLFIW